MWPAWVSAFSACVILVDDPRDERAAYDVCEADGECPHEAECLRVDVAHVSGVTGARMCTRTCEGADCPDDGVCVLAASGRSVCLARCALDRDCASGFACAAHDVDTVCYPL